MMSDVRALLPRMQAVCEMIASRLSLEQDRYSLLDLATALNIAAYLLHRADDEVRGHAFMGEPISVEDALRRMEVSLLYVRENSANVAQEEIRAHVERALHDAIDALVGLRRPNVS